MPQYRFTYACETSLRCEKDVQLQSKGMEITLASPEADWMRATLTIEASSWKDADVNAQPALQAVLDALSFATGAPMLISHWELILKDETGSAQRHALVCERSKQPARAMLTQQGIEEAQSILSASNPPELELCWHRYALQRELVLDRFVFQWLAFERLAGTHQVESRCPSCGLAVSHCGKLLTHSGSDRDNGFALLSKSDSELTEAVFKKEIWGHDRNSVFHGSKYPRPELLKRLQSLSPKLRRACEIEISARCGVADNQRPTGSNELNFYKYNMFEWNSAHPEDAFARDFPQAAIQEQFAGMKMGEVRMRPLDSSTFVLLDFAKDSATW